MATDPKLSGIMTRMGFPDTEAGPFVTALREVVGRQIDDGLCFRSSGTWAPGSDKLSAEDRARALLAVEWEIGQGHTYRVSQLDSPWGWRTDLRTMKRSFRVRLRAIPGWLGDGVRKAFCDVRVWWHRKVRGQRNPYAA